VRGDRQNGIGKRQPKEADSNQYQTKQNKLCCQGLPYKSSD